MTESTYYEYKIPWQWEDDHLKEKIRKNRHIERIRNELKHKKMEKKRSD